MSPDPELPTVPARDRLRQAALESHALAAELSATADQLMAKSQRLVDDLRDAFADASSSRGAGTPGDHAGRPQIERRRPRSR